MAAGFLVVCYGNGLSLCYKEYNYLDNYARKRGGNLFFFKHPWIFPMVIVLGGIATNLSRKRIPQVEQKPTKIKWWNFWLFGIIFIAAGIISEVARKNDWPNRNPINLFENTYRMGSLVFGGGQVLMPMMYEQF